MQHAIFIISVSYMNIRLLYMDILYQIPEILYASFNFCSIKRPSAARKGTQFPFALKETSQTIHLQKPNQQRNNVVDISRHFWVITVHDMTGRRCEGKEDNQ